MQRIFAVMLLLGTLILAGCQYLRQSQHARTLSQAKSQGYTACSRCDPPQ